MSANRFSSSSSSPFASVLFNRKPHPRILETAWQQLRNKGEIASMRDVAHAVGISRQAVYLYVGSRAGLLVQMVRYHDETSGIAERFKSALCLSPATVALDATLRAWFGYVPRDSPNCPCNLGSAPTHDYCHGNRLYQITEGHYEDTNLKGLEFMVTFSIREWAKLYVSDRATDAQMEALEKLTPHILGGFERSGIVSTKESAARRRALSRNGEVQRP